MAGVLPNRFLQRCEGVTLLLETAQARSEVTPRVRKQILQLDGALQQRARFLQTNAALSSERALLHKRACNAAHRAANQRPPITAHNHPERGRGGRVPALQHASRGGCDAVHRSTQGAHTHRLCFITVKSSARWQCAIQRSG